MAEFFDNVIIGAGPAGSACAITLQKNGESCCVIDKAVFPRHKTCAGLVTSKTHRLIKTLFGEAYSAELFCADASKIRFFNKGELLTTAAPKSKISLVNRRDFDNALTKRYRSLGGTLFDGEKIIRIDYKSNKIKLKSGKTIGFKNLIFADGALSMAHKALNIKKEKLGFGIEAYVPSEEFATDSVDLHFGYVADGYFWAFPHGDTVCVGFGNWYSKNTDYKKILDEFLREHGVDPEKQRYVGAFLPYGTVIPQKSLPKNVMLIGDAAGFTDPITGEGLYMSMKSGIAAAKAVNSADPKKTYLDSVKPLRRIVNDGKKAQKLFYTPAVHKRILERIKNSSGSFVGYYFDNMVEEYRYDYRSLRKLLNDYKK